MKLLHTPMIALLACLASAMAWAIDDGEAEAASPDDARYRIELLLFANSNPFDETVEQWFPPRTLQVPENLQTLMPPLPDATPEAEAATKLASQPAEPPAPEPGAAISQEETPPAERIEPFTELTDISRDFEQAADRMSRSRYYRVLGITAWEQSLSRGAEPVAVVIRAGEVFGQHHELEGTISLRRERYLHAHARLWLSRFTEYTGETNEEDLPALPLLPTPPERETINTSDTPALDGTGMDIVEADATDASPMAQEDGTETGNDPTEGVMPYDEWAEYDWFAPARPDRIVLMDQSRRLRSNELHYIDHPLFGVILRIVPVKTEDAISSAE